MLFCHSLEKNGCLVFVDSEGYVYPCCHAALRSPGNKNENHNISKRPLEEILAENPFEDFNKESNPLCYATCFKDETNLTTMEKIYGKRNFGWTRGTED